MEKKMENELESVGIWVLSFLPFAWHRTDSLAPPVLWCFPRNYSEVSSAVEMYMSLALDLGLHGNQDLSMRSSQSSPTSSPRCPLSL